MFKNVKQISVCVLVSMMLLASSWTAQGQSAATTELLHNLYFSSMAYPEHFDDSRELLEASSRKDELFECIIPLRANYWTQAQATVQQCQVHADPGAHWDCIKGNDASTIFYWIHGQTQLADGKVASWLDTLSGGTMYHAKRAMELLQPGLWVQIVSDGMPLVAQKLSCP